MEFIRSNLRRRHTSATEIMKEDLPVNPISHLILSMEGFNATNETTLAEMLSFINNVSVTDAGSTVLNLQGEDLYGQNCYLYRRRPHLTSKVAADNQTRSLGLVIPFGRKIFDPSECYPARSRGDLKLEVDVTALATSIDNGQWSIDAVELLGANPGQFMKTTRKSVTAPGATGDNDVSLPIGNKIIALQLRQVTFPGTSSHAYGVDQATVFRNNNEVGYTANNAQTLVADGIFRVDGQAGTVAAYGEILPDNIVWLDYDPHGDGNWLLETAGASDLFLRMEMGVDEAVDVVVMELVDV